MTVKKGDIVFVRSDAFHHNELPGIVVSPGGNCSDVLVLASGHPPFLMENLKEIDYWEDPEGFYQSSEFYPPRPEEPINADASEEFSEGGIPQSDSEGDGSGLVSSSEEEDSEQEEDEEGESEEEPEKVDESEADEKASEDRNQSDPKPPVAKSKIGSFLRRKR